MKDSNGDGAKLSLRKLAEEHPEDAADHAAAYARMGMAVVPNEGKKPRLKAWAKTRLAEEELPSRFADGQNVGLVNGEPSGGLVAVDMDVPEAPIIADRFLPETAKSGREGIPNARAWYRSPGAKDEKWVDTDGTVLLELRSDGDRHAWGLDGTAEPTEVPTEELKRRCDDLATATVVARRLPPEDDRHRFALALAASMLAPGRLDEESVIEILLAGWRAADAGGDEDANALMTMTWDVAEKLSSGDMAPGDSPLEAVAPGLPALLTGWRSWSAEDGAGAENAGGHQAVNGTGLGGSEGGPTHDELRDRWIAAQPAPKAFGLGSWHTFVTYWQPVHDQEVYCTVDRVLEAAKPEGTRPTAGARSSVERLARAKMFVADEKWDARDDILTCANGTLEIPGMILREHRPQDYALSAVPYPYDPTAEAPAWRAFLASTVPEVEGFLREYAGYCLTTDTSLEVALWLSGPPGGGKSTFIEGLKAMLGPRAGLLGLADIQRSRFALSMLPGKTLVVATEQPSEYIASTHVLNALISGEEVAMEKKFKDAFTFAPTAKICWAMNDLPRIREANSGLFRRVKVVPFPRLRVAQDPKLKDRIKAEAPGILNWALEGLHSLKERGRFELPEVVRNATEGFHEANDVPAMFVREACVASDVAGCEERAGVLYNAYRHWCRENGHKPLSSTAVAAEWARLGFGSRSLNGRKLYTGVKVDQGWIRAQEDYPRK